MMKFIVLILVVGVLYLLWRFFAKQKINATLTEQGKALSGLVQNDKDDEELPQKSKAIKQILDAERVKPNAILEQQPIVAQVEDVSSHEQDQRLFDEVAQLFFEKAIQVKDFNQAGRIQQEFLNKMPISTQSQCGSFDFGEWSIFWSYQDQSLEYYVGRYGVFYAHVNRDGIEKKAEFKNRV